MIGHETDWRVLVVESIRAPAEAARKIVDMQLSRSVLYQGAALMAALSALLAGLSGLIVPPPEPFNLLLMNPFGLFVLAFGTIIITAHLIYWTGRAMGGPGDLSDMLALIVWLQVLRFLVQSFLLVVSTLSPALAAMGGLIANLYGLWILVNFVNEGMQLGSVGKAAGVLITIFAGVTLGVFVLLTLSGVTNAGLVGDV